MGPSYVSSGSALSYWGLYCRASIYEILVTTNLARTYKTPIGRFRYIAFRTDIIHLASKEDLAPKQMTLMADKGKRHYATRLSLLNMAGIRSSFLNIVFSILRTVNVC